jgi:carbon monoxide dehydrogenase subunit G
MDIPSVADCVPGVESLTAHGEDRYSGVLRVAIGPIVVHLDGALVVLERDEARNHARMRAEATDGRVRGGVTATITMSLSTAEAGATQMEITTDAVVMGRLGEFGQPIVRRKADQILAEFARRLSENIAAATSTNAGER